MRFLLLCLFCCLIASLSCAEALPSTRYLIDDQNSKIAWIGHGVTGSHAGTILLANSTLEILQNKLISADISADMHSISDSDLSSKPKLKAELEAHLKGPDFFDVEKFPRAHFKSLQVKEIPVKIPELQRYRMMGELTIRGITRPVEIMMYGQFWQGRFSTQGRLALDRTEFGIKYNSRRFFSLEALGDKLVQDRFILDFEITASRG